MAKATKPKQEEATPEAFTPQPFELDGKKYNVIVHATIIPGMGTLTAKEIAADEAAQKYLVENECTGVIDEVA